MITDEEFLIFILPLILLVGSATITTAFALPPNTTDWNWGSAYPEGSYDDGYPVSKEKECNCEMTDDDLEEQEELEDEKAHEEWAKDNER